MYCAFSKKEKKLITKFHKPGNPGFQRFLSSKLGTSTAEGPNFSTVPCI